MVWFRRNITATGPTQPVVIQVATVGQSDTQTDSSNIQDNQDQSDNPMAESQSAASNESATCILKSHFCFLYQIALCPFPVEDGSQENLTEKLHQVFFWIMSVLAIVHTMDGVKLYSGNLKKGDLDQILAVGFVIIRGCIKFFFIKVVSKHWGKVKALISAASGMEQNNNPGHRVSHILTVVKALVIIMSITRCLFRSLTLKEWSPREAVLQRSFEAAYTLLLWRNETIFNATIVSQVAKEYGGNITLTNVMMGGSGMVLDICGSLQFYATWYLMLVQALSLQRMIGGFNKHFPLPDGWKYLNDMQDVCGNVEEVFGIVFKLLHLNNTMVFAYFLFYWLIKAEYDIQLFLIFVDTVLILVTYYLAAEVAKMNDDVSHYVLYNSSDMTHINLGTNNIPISFLLERLTRYPVGIGRNTFLIDEAFTLKFLCVVGSYLVFMEERNR